jgi:hypothetical protein
VRKNVGKSEKYKRINWGENTHAQHQLAASSTQIVGIRLMSKDVSILSGQWWVGGS